MKERERNGEEHDGVSLSNFFVCKIFAPSFEIGEFTFDPLQMLVHHSHISTEWFCKPFQRHLTWFPLIPSIHSILFSSGKSTANSFSILFPIHEFCFFPSNFMFICYLHSNRDDDDGYVDIGTKEGHVEEGCCWWSGKKRMNQTYSLQLKFLIWRATHCRVE